MSKSKMDKKPEDIYPKVGIGVMVFKNGKILLGLRRGSHGAGEYAFPGGHQEYMESFSVTARREVKEECGLEIKNIRFVCLENLKTYRPKHYVHIGLIADWKKGRPQIKEPDKCLGWDWYDLDRLPAPLFGTIKNTIKSFQTGRNFWDR